MMIEIIATMFAVGLILGFVGAGGSGFIISILTTVFGYPIHTVLGTAIWTMLLSSASGAFSHYRERNVALKTGAVVGAAGAVGAWFGSSVSVGIPGGVLERLTASMLILSGLALWWRMSMAARHMQKDGAAETMQKDGAAEKAQTMQKDGAAEKAQTMQNDGTANTAQTAQEGKAANTAQTAQEDGAAEAMPTAKFWTLAIIVGLVTGALSGTFGIGSTPFIQIGLMAVLGLPVRLAAGTTMLVIIPIALGGGLGFYHLGHVDVQLLIAVAASVMAGSYIGAKFTKRAPLRFLKTAMVVVPMIGGAILLL